VDRDPLFDRKRVDCVTFVEQVLAEATATRPAETMLQLHRIRYLRGEIGFRTRNHFTVTDWLPHNEWLLRDVTDTVAAGHARSMVKIIDRAAFLRGRGCDPAGAGQERCETRYIPREALSSLANRIAPATLAILVQRRAGIIAAHCGWLLRPAEGPLVFRHASERRGRVVDEPFLEYLRRQPRNIAGVKLCVVRAS
jgi:D-alanyl-D-alanine carboxypeptidase/D-alanyl-D-alanine-endopeptidase (penicillin-binding protein 4)